MGDNPVEVRILSPALLASPEFNTVDAQRRGTLLPLRQTSRQPPGPTSGQHRGVVRATSHISQPARGVNIDSPHRSEGATGVTPGAIPSPGRSWIPYPPVVTVAHNAARTAETSRCGHKSRTQYNSNRYWMRSAEVTKPRNSPSSPTTGSAWKSPSANTVAASLTDCPT